LTQALDFLDRSRIKKFISKQHSKLLDDLLIFDELPSTNDFLASQARKQKNVNLACLAEQQTAGRGRLGRQWVSPFAANIYLSLLWRFNCDISELGGLSIAAGVATAEAIITATEISDIKLKWPNDIFCHDRKLGGILIDIVGECSGGCSAVIGIGINVNMPQQVAATIEKPWTDLRTATGQEVCRNKIAGLLIDKLISNLLSFQENGIGVFIQPWNRLDYLAGKRTRVQSGNTTLDGIALGINKQGYLLLAADDGAQVAVTTGDASIISSK
jgi:BirA family biotin operon repressor/biotin-[acetyl-CoA-carboxylase] ligase